MTHMYDTIIMIILVKFETNANTYVHKRYLLQTYISQKLFKRSITAIILINLDIW